MRLFLVSVALLSSVVASANCPDLAGEYTCVDAEGYDSQISVAQADTDGIRSYQLTEYNTNIYLVADGQKREIVTEDEYETSVSLRTVWCEGSAVKWIEDAEYFDKESKSKLGNLKFKYLLSSSESAGMRVQAHVDGNYDNEKVDLEVDVACTKKQ
jgi:hypothetical protein